MIEYIPFILSIVFTPEISSAGDGETLYGVAKRATPVYDASNFPTLLGRKNFLNKDGLFMNHVFTAFLGARFEIQEQRRDRGYLIYRVTTGEYECRTGCWVDARFLSITRVPPPERYRRMPTRREILRRLNNMVAQGLRYCWGCNTSAGIPDNLMLYGRGPGGHESRHWLMKGGDCSGILYEATDGATPRDTHDLIGYGRAVPIQRRNQPEVLARLKPLDLIIWYGHVLIVLEDGWVLEAINKYHKAKLQRLLKTRLEMRLWEIMRKQLPVNAYHRHPAPLKKKFAVRRWHPEQL